MKLFYDILSYWHGFIFLVTYFWLICFVASSANRIVPYLIDIHYDSIAQYEILETFVLHNFDFKLVNFLLELVFS